MFNDEKLLWMNKEHIRLQTKEEQLSCIKNYFKEYPPDVLSRLLPTIIDRISMYGELASIEVSEFRFFIAKPHTDRDSLQKIIWRDTDLGEARMHLEAIKTIVSTGDFSSPLTLKDLIMPYAEANGKGNVLWPLRMALSGQEKSVDPFTVCYVLGKDEVISRITGTILAIDS